MSSYIKHHDCVNHFDEQLPVYVVGCNFVSLNSVGAMTCIVNERCCINRSGLQWPSGFRVYRVYQRESSDLKVL